MTEIKKIDFNALMQVKACQGRLTAQQFRTLRGQVYAGDGDAALKGLRKLLMRQREGAAK